MLYMPLPGTPLHAEVSAQGRMLDEAECPAADTHGQFRFNYRHPHIRAGLESELLVRAFRARFRGQRPEHGADAADHPGRLEAVQEPPRSADSAAFCLGSRGDGDHLFRGRRGGEAVLPEEPGPVRQDVAAAGGHEPRVRLDVPAVCGSLGGPYVLWKIRQEERRLAAGWTYEPPTFYEVNDAVTPGGSPAASRCRYVTPQVVSPEIGVRCDAADSEIQSAVQAQRSGSARQAQEAVTSDASGSRLMQRPLRDGRRP